MNKTRERKTWASGNKGITCKKGAKGILRRMVKGDSRYLQGLESKGIGVDQSLQKILLQEEETDNIL